MQFENEIHIWLTSAMLGVGMLVFFLGLWILILPTRFLKTSQSLGKWVSTEKYFDALDKPHYQESSIYRHHRFAGSLIVLGAAYTLVVLITRVDINVMAAALPTVINLFWSEWLYGAIYILLTGANILAVVVGVVIFTRPSMLKSIENTLNTWMVTDRRLKKLDEVHEISIDVFPGGNPRLFGLAVTLGGLYIMLSMAVMLL